MRRILAFDSRDAFLFELDPSQVTAAVRTVELNGAHALDISTAQALPLSTRLLLSDGMGGWEEYVVSGGDEDHDSGLCAVGSYHAVWSCQYDLRTVNADDVEVGGDSDVGCADAMALALDGTSRWRVGTVDAPGASTFLFESKSAWERVQMVAEQYGGEIAQRVVVGRSGVTERYVDMRARIGSVRVTRRFEWKRDLTRIVRRVPEQPLCCRIIPVGSSADVTIYDVNTSYRHYDSNGGFVTDQVPFVEDQEAALVYRMPDGQGGWEYPTRRVKFDIDDDRELLAYALEHVSDYTRPTPTYEADVLQYAAAGMDWTGVALGDPVHVVDEGFNPDVPLRIEARVVAMTENLLDPTDVQLKVGDISEGLSSTLRMLDGAIAGVSRRVSDVFGGGSGTARYIEWVTEQLNSYINALGGYSYIVPGDGIITYSVPVTDPSVGDEAKQVIRNGGQASVTWIGGGGIKIANSLDSRGNWEWKTLIVAGKIATELLTANNIITGKIQDARERITPGTGSFWDLDSGQFVNRSSNVETVIGNTGQVSGSSLWKRLASSVSSKVTDGYGFEVRRVGWIGIYPSLNDDLGSSGYHWGSIIGSGRLVIAALGNNTTKYPFMKLGTNYVDIGIGELANSPIASSSVFTAYDSEVRIRPPVSTSSLSTFGIVVGSSSTTIGGDTQINGSLLLRKLASNAQAKGNLTVQGDLTVSGTKPRLVETESYNDRLLYAYETPAPYFGDIGTARTDPDGFCIVSVDDVFRETVRTDMGYQVFLQACGDGALWVAEKRADCFIVQGAPNLAFDWEVKAHQRDYELTRTECKSRDDMAEQEMYEAESASPTFDTYGDYVTEMEELYASEIQEEA